MKKWKVILAAGVVVLACAGCGAQKTEDVGAVEAVPVDEVRTQNGPEESEEAEKEPAQSEEAGTENESLQSEEISAENGAEESGETQNASTEIAAFAEEIQAAVAAKDMDALAGLCAYPLAVNGEVIESKEAFMELGADTVFTEERCAVIEAVDVSALEEMRAGVIMGDATPNIIFKSADGNLGITGIN